MVNYDHDITHELFRMFSSYTFKCIYPLMNISSFPSPSSPWKLPFYSLSVSLSSLIPYISEIIQYLSFYICHFTEHNDLKVLLCCCKMQNFLLSHDLIIFSCTQCIQLTFEQLEILLFRGTKHDNPLQYSCLENPMDYSRSGFSVHGVTRVRHDLATKPPPPSPPAVKNLSVSL